MANPKRKKDNRGGARPGAGRPKSSTSKLLTFRAVKEVADYLGKQENKTSIINSSLLEHIHQEKAGRETIIDTNLGTVIPGTYLEEARIPYYDVSLVAGYPLPVDNNAMPEDINLTSMLSPHPATSYLIRVHGSSMIDANISDGDLLVVDRSQRSPGERDIAVCEFNGEYTVKYVQRHGGKICLVPANPQFPVIPVADDDEFNIWGVVTYIIHKAH